MNMKLDNQELATVLAALRYYQAQGMGEPENRSDAIHDLATNGGEVTSLDDTGIDSLCERLNFADDSEVPTTPEIEKPTVFVMVEGGCVTGVYAPPGGEDPAYQVIDFDNLESGGGCPVCGHDEPEEGKPAYDTDEDCPSCGYNNLEDGTDAASAIEAAMSVRE